MSSNYISIPSKHFPIKSWTKKVKIDDNAVEQLQKIASLPFIFQHIAVMPDVHIGKGATVGSVIPTTNAIIPAAVGGDIGCGMNAVRISLKGDELPDNLYKIRRIIEKGVPVGKEQHKRSSIENKDNKKTFGTLERGLKDLILKYPSIEKIDKHIIDKSIYQMGTLGSGNHFIEICLDEKNDVWIMLHSGSRGVGNNLGNFFIELAKKDIQKTLGNQFIDQEISYFEEDNPHFNDYFLAIDWAQEYARLNRKRMMEIIIKSLKKVFPKFSITQEAINCHHNYINIEKHFGQNVYITRKGAVSAQFGELGIIPGSMGAKSFIVKGKGNTESFCSCSHGAGRLMSRSKAKKTFTLEQHEKDTQLIECRKDMGIIDETPRAYKNIDDVMESQKDLVDIIHTLKQIICIKG